MTELNDRDTHANTAASRSHPRPYQATAVLKQTQNGDAGHTRGLTAAHLDERADWHSSSTSGTDSG